MKRHLLVFFLSLFIVPFVVHSGDTAAKASTIKLNLSDVFPAVHEQHLTVMKWAKEIGKRTNGRVEIVGFPGGTLLTPPQIYTGTAKGVSDIGSCLFAYTRGRFPVMAALDLPFGYPNGAVASKVVQDFGAFFNPPEIQDVKVLYLHGHGPGFLHTKKPVRNLEDLKGLKIRATGLSAQIVTALGAVPVAMHMGEAYEALQKGIVEGTINPPAELKGFKQAEVIKYTTECPLVGYTTAFFVIMNLNKWNSLPDDIKKVFEEVSKEWTDNNFHGEEWVKIDKQGLEYSKSLGNEVISLSSEENARWREAVRPVIDDYIAKTENGNKYVAKIRELLEKYSK